MPVVNPGIRRFLASAIQRLFNGASFSAPLTHSAIPTRAASGTTTTFTRATTAPVRDNEGVLRTAIAGEARFEGARRVHNWIQSPTENWANAGWVKTNMTVSGNRLTATGANASIYDSLALSMGTERTALASITLSRVTGTGNIDISTNGGTTWTTVSVTGARVSVSLTGNINGQLAIRIVTSGDAIDATYPQLEDITGRADQTTPSEYVSGGALDYRSEQDPLYAVVPGIGGQHISTPDSTAASVTGSIAGVIDLSMADYTPAASSVLLDKASYGGGNASYSWYVNTAGRLVLELTPDGTGASAATATSSVAPTAVDGIRSRLGFSWNQTTKDVKFWTSTDGTTWTQLGTTQTANIASIFDCTRNLQLGERDGALSLNAKVYSAQIYNGIPPIFGGAGSATPVVDFNPQRDATTPTGTITSSTTGEVWTLNGASSVVRNATYHGAGVDGVEYFDTDLDGNPLPTQYTYDAVSLNGVAGTYVSTPDSVAASITGDIDIRVKAAMSDWTPAATNVLVDKSGAAGQFSYRWYLTAAGVLTFQLSTDGTVVPSAATSAALGITDGTIKWLRVTWRASDGRVQFFTSDDGSTWSQSGSNGAISIPSIFNGTDILVIGSTTINTFNCSGRIHQAQIYNGINGTLAVDFDASRYAGGSTLTGSTGETWTLQGNAVIHPTNSPNTGYQAEGARTNLCLQSQTFDSWTDSGASVTANTTVAPDGTTTADTIVRVSGQGDARFVTPTLVSNAVHAVSLWIKKGTSPSSLIALYDVTAVTYRLFADVTWSGTTPVFAFTNGSLIRSTEWANGLWRIELLTEAVVAANTNRLYIYPGRAGSANGETVIAWGAQVELGSFASSYIPTTTIAVARNADVEAVSTSGNIAAAAGSVYLEYTPTHSPSGTIAFWGTYVDASNYTAIIHDATNLIFRKRIAGVNYDATIANAFVSGTTYKACATWGASGTSITLNGTEGTPHANTTAAQIAATMQWGADGNSLQQPFASVRNCRDWLRQLSASERAAVTA